MPKIAFFGHFGQGNTGNDGSLWAMLIHLRRLAPNAELTCVCTGPSIVAATYDIVAVPIRISLARRWTPRGQLGRLARRLFVVMLGEPRQWLHALRTLRDKDALVVPGTGLLNDTGGLLMWGPYDMFRWSFVAKICGCKLLFVSVGAGPLYSRAGRFFVKNALSLADFRSYRDESTRHYLEGVWSPAGGDPIYPDLVFSLPQSLLPAASGSRQRKPVVGLGLMKDPGSYTEGRRTGGDYSAYLGALLDFAQWLLTHGYNVRLLLGDVADAPLLEEFRSLLLEQPAMHETDEIICEPIESVEGLLRQLALTDLVLATRFHNVLFALLLTKPTMSITFHHKCSSLMNQMGLSGYCQNINRLDSGRLIEQFSQLQRDADSLKETVAQGVEAFRGALDEQYRIVCKEICSDRQRT